VPLFLVPGTLQARACRLLDNPGLGMGSGRGGWTRELKAPSRQAGVSAGFVCTRLSFRARREGLVSVP